MNYKYSVYHCKLPANKIFGSVGRCGGGYNSVWEDWSVAGRAKRELIMQEFELGMNAICGHYGQLEEDVLANGFRNPIVVTSGTPIRRTINHIPPELRGAPPGKLLTLEGDSGGSRLWVAQKHNLLVDCIINDETGFFRSERQLRTLGECLALYTDVPEAANLGRMGFSSCQLSKTHIDDKWTESALDKERRPMWEEIMNRHGYPPRK